MDNSVGSSRRSLLTMIGKVGGTAAMYQAMTALGHAAESKFTGPLSLTGAPPGSKILVLGAGLAGLVAAYELRKAGYSVKIIEYQDRPGGRSHTVRGGDRITEVGGSTQLCEFKPGNYFNPGPWRIPHHHQNILHYCKILGVELQPFIQLNHNGFIHRTKAFGGKPQRYRELVSDFNGHVSELLAKSLSAGKLDNAVSKEDSERLIAALRDWGILDGDLKYRTGLATSYRRGYEKSPGGGVTGEPIPSKINNLSDVLDSRAWVQMSFYLDHVMQAPMLHPKGGMDAIPRAFANALGNIVNYNTKVTKIAQNENVVTVSCENMRTKQRLDFTADYCVCTIPLGVLKQIDPQVSPEVKAAIGAVPYSGQLKIALEMRRRFWEDDYSIFGGHSFTDQHISAVSYPNFNFFSTKPAVIVGAMARDAGAYVLAGMTPEKRIEAALTQGSVFHPAEYRKEFMNGVSWAWSRTPWTLGCCSLWTDESRNQHYENLVKIDGRIVLAGEHASYYGCWQEGAILSARDAIERLHARALAP